MANTVYAEKLRDPRWMERRKEILEKDKLKCRNCLSGADLEVHHRAYLSGAEPWQYPDEFLITLCRRCHEEEEDYKKEIKTLVDSLSLSGVPYKDIYEFLLGLKTENGK